MTPNARSLFDFGPLAGEYDRWYDKPAGRFHDRQQKALVRSFLAPARPGERLLDVGCGTGHWSRFFASLGYSVVGVDISAEMIEVARANVSPPCVFEIADACNLPFDTDSFEVVAGMVILEFVSDAPGMLTEMFRCAAPSGRILIGTLNKIAPINQHRLDEDKEPYASGKLLSPRELRRLLEPFGHVRMAGTGEQSKKRAIRLWRLVNERLGVRHPKLDGAFIVAEVRP